MVPCSHEIREPGLAVPPEGLLLTKHTNIAALSRFWPLEYCWDQEEVSQLPQA